VVRLRNGQWAIALVCVILGFMIAVQFKVQQRIARDVSVQRSQELVSQLQKVEAERKALAEELVQLRARLSGKTGAEASGELKEELELAMMQAGLVPLKGQGVTVVLDDSKRPLRPGEDPNAFILHDEDLLKVVNELAAGGAEAIAINGQRLIGRSEIRCAGPTISINNVRTAPPVTIVAIGDPQVLEASLRLRGGVVDSLSFWGIQVTIKREAEVTVPAYKGSLKFTHARPVTGGGARGGKS
jgi:uncharacterized protein YlxW (UPF0749 family)